VNKVEMIQQVCKLNKEIEDLRNEGSKSKKKLEDLVQKLEEVQGNFNDFC
jgi:uncharacterized coiled-coil protein SlyX